MVQKRQDYITWDEYFMGVAYLSAKRSKDPNTQVGSCIVSSDHKILSMGYNGLPRGCSDDMFPWSREGQPLMTKYPFVTHSELNAILNYRGGSLEGMTATSTRAQTPQWLVSACSTPQVYVITSTPGPAGRSNWNCRIRPVRIAGCRNGRTCPKQREACPKAMEKKKDVLPFDRQYILFYCCF